MPLEGNSLLGVNPSRQHGLRSIEQLPGDRRDRLGRFAFAKDDFGKAAARLAVGVDAGNRRRRVVEMPGGHASSVMGRGGFAQKARGLGRILNCSRHGPRAVAEAGMFPIWFEPDLAE
jgi:hypothetical protein